MPQRRNYRHIAICENLRTNFKADFFGALAHRGRIRILERLREGEDPALGRGLGLDQAAVSRQLAVLRRQGIVEAAKVGPMTRYRVRDTELFQLSSATLPNTRAVSRAAAAP